MSVNIGVLLGFDIDCEARSLVALEVVRTLRIHIFGVLVVLIASVVGVVLVLVIGHLLILFGWGL